jgi:sec-independent protein translocase protein TatB
MLDIGGGELLVIGIVALVVIGPKELPGLLRTAGNAMGKVRRMAAEFRGQFDEAMREAELEEAKKAFNSVDDAARSASTGGFNPLDTIRNEIKAVKEEMKGPQPAPDVSPAAAPAAEAVVAAPVADPIAPPPAVAAVEAAPPTAVEADKTARTSASTKIADSGNAA